MKKSTEENRETIGGYNKDKISIGTIGNGLHC